MEPTILSTDLQIIDITAGSPFCCLKLEDWDDHLEVLIDEDAVVPLRNYLNIIIKRYKLEGVQDGNGPSRCT